MSELVITEIWIYPVKSLGGIQLHSAKVLPKGLEHDRRWMLIDGGNQFMTQRTFPAMALFRLLYESGKFSIRHGNQVIGLPLSHGNTRITATIWDDTVDVYEVSPAHSEWFSEILGMDCRLVSFPEENARPVDPRYSIHHEQVSLADAYPLLIIGQSSLDNLNQRLREPLPMNRFRPNLVFKGGEPYEEDSWKEFRVGLNRFAAVKPCARCVVTTVDQETAIKGKEPLATLSSYRRKDNNVYFGQNLLPLDHFEISTGDQIVLEQE